MKRKRRIKERIGMVVYEKKALNRKILNMEKSFREVKHILGGDKKK